MVVTMIGLFVNWKMNGDYFPGYSEHSVGSRLTMNQGTFSDYHWKAGDTLVKEPSVGGYFTNGSYRGIFHTIIGNDSSVVSNGAMYQGGSCSRLSKN